MILRIQGAPRAGESAPKCNLTTPATSGGAGAGHGRTGAGSRQYGGRITAAAHPPL